MTIAALTAELDPPDACPRCFPGDAPACLPLAVQDVEGGILASYEHDCGAAWQTLFDAFGWPVERTAAPVAGPASRAA